MYSTTNGVEVLEIPNMQQVVEQYQKQIKKLESTRDKAVARRLEAWRRIDVPQSQRSYNTRPAFSRTLASHEAMVYRSHFICPVIFPIYYHLELLITMANTTNDIATSNSAAYVVFVHATNMDVSQTYHRQPLPANRDPQIPRFTSRMAVAFTSRKLSFH